MPTKLISMLTHGCDMGWLPASPGGIHPPYLEMGYERAFAEGFWGNTPHYDELRYWGTFPAFRGSKYSWFSGTWPDADAPIVGYYPIGGSSLICSPRTPQDTPPKALASGFEEALKTCGKLHGKLGLTMGWYTGLPKARNMTYAQIDATYALAKRIGVTQIDVDVLGGCSAVNASGSGQSNAMKVRNRLLDTFPLVVAEPLDIVTPALLPYYDGRMGFTVAGSEWRYRWENPGYANKFCPGIAKQHEIILPGSVSVSQRLADSVAAVRMACPITIEFGGIPRADLETLLRWAENPGTANPVFSSASTVDSFESDAGYRLSGGWPTRKIRRVQLGS